MSSNRYVQNFRQRRALLLSNDTRAADAISIMVERLGLTVERLPLNEADLRATCWPQVLPATCCFWMAT